MRFSRIVLPLVVACATLLPAISHAGEEIHEHGHESDCGPAKPTVQLTPAQAEARRQKLLQSVPGARAGSFAEVSRVITREQWNHLKPVQRRMVATRLHKARAGIIMPEMCFAPGTDIGTVETFEGLNTSISATSGSPNALRVANMWTRTATTPSIARGQGFTLTWSLIPDGVAIENIDDTVKSSDLLARARAIYGGNSSTDNSGLITRFTAMFARYEELTGIRYIYEPNDDGAPLASGMANQFANGQRGVRGDVRIGGINIDGPSNVLAFNYFPGVGDMVIDTSESNSRFTSNLFIQVIAHEHGHGLGLSHTCPVNQTKLMEPFANGAFVGAQLDDVLGVQRSYGDTNEAGAGNDTVATATDIGTRSAGTFNYGQFPTTPMGQSYQFLTTQKPVTIDGNNDTDVYRFNVDAANRTASVTVTPVGETYLEGAQNGDGSCSAGTPLNPKTFSPLRIELLNAAGTVIAQNTATLGQAVTIAATNLTGTGPFYARVSESGTDAQQVYTMALTIAAQAVNTPPRLNNATYTIPTNVAFSQQLAGSDAEGDTLSYALTGGTTLPAGLTLSGAGLISGTPTTAGRTDFSVTVNDGRGGTLTAQFIIIVSATSDGIGPRIVRSALPASTTRDALANMMVTGTITDVAGPGVTPSGVSRMIFQIRRGSDGFSYSGPGDGFTDNPTRGYYPGTLGAPSPATTAGTRDFSRSLSWLPQLAPGNYTFNVIGQDVAGNWSVEVVPITIVATQPTVSTPPTSAPITSGRIS